MKHQLVNDIRNHRESQKMDKKPILKQPLTGLDADIASIQHLQRQALSLITEAKMDYASQG